MIKYTDFFDKYSDKNVDEFSVNDIDNPSGWHWKDLDHLINMGFDTQGDTRLKLSDKKDYNETLEVEIYKQKSTKDYVMLLNGRKHVFHTFTDLLDFIDAQRTS